MIVEMIGIPGAGKTSMLPTVTSTLADFNFKARRVVDAGRPFARRDPAGAALEKWAPRSIQPKLLWQVFYWRSYAARRRFARKNPELIAHVRQAQRSRQIPRADRRHALYWFFHLTGYYEYLLSHMQPGEALVMDEGFTHRVVQLFATGKEKPDLDSVRRYIDLIPRPDLLIALRAPSELCEARVYRRGIWSRMKGRSGTEISRYFSNAETVVAWTLKYVESIGWPVIHVENQESRLSLARENLRWWLVDHLTLDTGNIRQNAMAVGN